MPACRDGKTQANFPPRERTTHNIASMGYCKEIQKIKYQIPTHVGYDFLQILADHPQH